MQKLSEKGPQSVIIDQAKFTFGPQKTVKEVQAVTVTPRKRAVFLRTTEGTGRERTVVASSKGVQKNDVVVEAPRFAYLTQIEALNAVMSEKRLRSVKKRTLLVVPIFDADMQQVGKLITQKGLRRHKILLEITNEDGRHVRSSFQSELFSRGTTALRRVQNDIF